MTILNFSGAPSVYSLNYTDWSETQSDLLGTIQCFTQYSPPTNVTWMRDRIAVGVDRIGLQMIQNSNGASVLLEVQQHPTHKKCCSAGWKSHVQLHCHQCCQHQHQLGQHNFDRSVIIYYEPYFTVFVLFPFSPQPSLWWIFQWKKKLSYECRKAWPTCVRMRACCMRVVTTPLDRSVVVALQNLTPPFFQCEPFNITCRASLHRNVASHLIQYLVLDWVGTKESD